MDKSRLAKLTTSRTIMMAGSMYMNTTTCNYLKVLRYRRCISPT
jgi:hypothetical protein